MSKQPFNKRSVFFYLILTSIFITRLYPSTTDEFLRNEGLSPYALGYIRQSAFITDIIRYYPELQVELYKTKLTLIAPFYSKGVSIAIENEKLDILARLSFELSYGFRLLRARTLDDEYKGNGYFIGLGIGIKRLEYDKKKFRLAEPDPLFSKYGYKKSSYSLSLGIARRTNQYRLGLALGQSIPPSENLESSDNGMKLSRFHTKLELELKFKERLFLGAQAGYENGIKAELASEYWIKSEKLGVRLKTSINGLTTGIFFKPNNEKGIEIRYYLYYPYKLDGLTTHQIMLLWRRKPIPPAWPDISPIKIELVGPPVQSLPNTLAIELKNNGKKRAGSFFISIAQNNETVTEFRSRSMEPNSTQIIKIPFTPTTIGTVKIELTADSRDEILETNEMNNKITKIFEIYPYPKVELQVENETLTLIQKTDIFLNEPLVPLIFFDEHSSRVDTSYRKTIIEIARRLKENPDVILEVKGYYDKESDKVADEQSGKALAIARAESVKTLFKKEGIADNRIRIIESGYDPSTKRAYKQDFEGTKRGTKLIAEENRRVELNATLEIKNPLLKAETDTLPDIFLKNFDDLSQLLKRNPDIIVMVSVIGDKKSQGDYNKYLRKARLSAEKIKAIVEDKLRNRIYFEHIPARSDSLYLMVSVLASPIVFDPVKVERKAEQYALSPKSKPAKFITNLLAKQGIIYYKLTIEDENGTIFWFFSGEENPKTIEWNWQNIRGEYPSVWSSYTARLFIRDEFGLESLSEPVPIFIKLENVENLIENLILTQYTFGELESEIEHHNARIEYIAKKILTRLKNESDVKIEVGGHTDNIGVKEGNMRLSQERAKAATEKLRSYMFELLDLAPQDNLDNFFASKGIKLEYKGYGDTKAFAVTDYSGNIPRKVLIGTNSTPLGRIINRRVEINLSRQK